MSNIIQPDSTVWLLNRCPIEPTYENSVFFTNPQTQAEEFEQYARVSDQLTNYSYVRKRRNVIRVQKRMQDVIDCNYMMFKNSAFENKWFYAFITSIDYVNNETTDISFVLDPLQTWMCDIEFNDSFIERENVDPDTDVGDQYLLPEGLDSGPYKVYRHADFFKKSDFVFIIAATWRMELNPDYTVTFYKGGGSNINGLYSGLYYNKVVAVGGLDVGSWIQRVIEAAYSGGTWADGTQRGDITTEIVSIFYAPIQLFPEPGTAQAVGTSYETEWDSFVKRGDEIPGDKSWSSGEEVPAYVPRNKKLLSAPYQQLVLTNYNGDTKAYSYEYFYQPDDEPSTIFTYVPFHILGDYNTPTPNVYAFPMYYKDQQIAVNEGFAMGGVFPQASWSVDAYKSFLANTGIATAIDGIQNFIKGGGSTDSPNIAISNPSETSSTATTSSGSTFIDPRTGKERHVPERIASAGGYMNYINQQPDSLGEAVQNAVSNVNVGEWATIGLGALGGTLALASGSASGIFNTIFNHLKTMYEYSLMPNHGLGSQTGFSRALSGIVNIGAYHVGITSKYAERLDKYFDMFGYRVDRVGKPMLWGDRVHARRYWNYVKTSNCSIKNKMPYDDYLAICKIFDNGIRLWSNIGSVGNYNHDNTLTYVE